MSASNEKAERARREITAAAGSGESSFGTFFLDALRARELLRRALEEI